MTLNPLFGNDNNPYAAMPPPGAAYTSSLLQDTSMNMDMTGTYPSDMSMPMDINDSSMAMMGNDMAIFSGGQYPQDMSQGYMMTGPNPLSHQSTDRLQMLDPYQEALALQRNVGSAMSSGTSSQTHSSTPSQSRPPNDQSTTPNSLPGHIPGPASRPLAPSTVPSQQEVVEPFRRLKFPWTTPPEGFPSTMTSPHVKTQFKNAYSSSGFDMLRALVCPRT